MPTKQVPKSLLKIIWHPIKPYEKCQKSQLALFLWKPISPQKYLSVLSSAEWNLPKLVWLEMARASYSELSAKLRAGFGIMASQLSLHTFHLAIWILGMAPWCSMTISKIGTGTKKFNLSNNKFSYQKLYPRKVRPVPARSFYLQIYWAEMKASSDSKLFRWKYLLLAASNLFKNLSILSKCELFFCFGWARHIFKTRDVSIPPFFSFVWK